MDKQRKVKFFPARGNDLTTVEGQVNDWIARPEVQVVSIQMEHMPSMDQLVIMVHYCEVSE